MRKQPAARPPIRFEGWEIDTHRRALRFGGRRARPEPLVFDLIHYLARHADRVVSKEELLQAIWGGTVVSHWAIARAVKEARRIFRENGLDPRILQTFRGRGYLLVGPARSGEAAGAEEGAGAPGTLVIVLRDPLSADPAALERLATLADALGEVEIRWPRAGFEVDAQPQEHRSGRERRWSGARVPPPLPGPA